MHCQCQTQGTCLVCAELSFMDSFHDSCMSSAAHLLKRAACFAG